MWMPHVLQRDVQRLAKRRTEGAARASGLWGELGGLALSLVRAAVEE